MTRFRTLLLLVALWGGEAVAADGASARLLLISVDGLRPDALTTDTAPRISVWQATAAVAGECLNDLPSATLPNHTGMLTGLNAGTHGVLLNIDQLGLVPFPTLFDYAADAGLRCAFLAGKPKLRYLAPPESVEVIEIDADSPALTERALDLLQRGQLDVLFLHYRDPDSVGHAAGWMSPAYLAAVAAVDTQVGRLFDAIADQARPTYVILTADHGGEDHNHFLNTPASRRIPWIVAGPDIRTDAPLPATLSVIDTTPTALWLLGIDVPTGLDGHAQTALRAGSPSDAALAVPPLGPPCVLFLSPLLLVLALDASRWRRKER